MIINIQYYNYQRDECGVMIFLYAKISPTLTSCLCSAESFHVLLPWTRIANCEINPGKIHALH